MDYAKIEEGKRLIAEGGGFGVLVWTAGDITTFFDCTEEQAEDWLADNLKYAIDAGAEHIYEYIDSECDFPRKKDLEISTQVE